MLRINYNLNEALLNVFNVCAPVSEKTSPIVMNDLVKYGVAVMSDGKLVSELPSDLYNLLMKEFGYTYSFNNCFHKSLEKVAESSLETLLTEQVLHYFSTYGLESFGFKATPYIPLEALNVPDDIELPFTSMFIVKLVSIEQAESMIYDYITTCRAPSASKMCYIVSLMEYLLKSRTISPDELVSNELKCALYSLTNTLPAKADDFLRYIVYFATGSALLIKNKTTIQCLKYRAEDNNDDFNQLFTLMSTNLMVECAKIFYRFKPLFLACKNATTAPVINKIRRLAVKYHCPLPDTIVKNLTTLAFKNRWSDVDAVISKMSLFDLIKLYNHVSFLLSSNPDRVYNIRNGKLFITSQDHKGMSIVNNNKLSCKLYAALYEKIKGKLDGKTFYIPSYIDYAAPISEKQFINNIPYGTKVLTDTNACSVAIAWNNVDNQRVDIDLHLTGTYGSFGWNSSHKDDDVNIIYSGDMTDATNGAAEAFYIDKYELDAPLLLNVHKYCGPNVPYKFLITNKKFEVDENNYRPVTPPIDVADAIFPPINLALNDISNQNIGIIYKNQFMFFGGIIGEDIIPNRDLSVKASLVLADKLSNMMSLESLLSTAGAYIITNKEQYEKLSESDVDVIDLSPNGLQANTIIDIVNNLNK